MADPSYYVHYHDSYDNDDIVNFMSIQNASLAGLSSINEPISYPSTNPQINNNNDGIADDNDPLVDPNLLEMFNGSNNNNNNGGSYQAGPSEIRGETSNRGGQNLERENLGSENARQFSVWPVEAVPFLCSCCQVLREIIHTNGQDLITRLEIHGRLGMICHAILEIRQGDNVTSSSHEYSMIDFCKKSIENVKQFLVQYCDWRKQAGFMMVPDPLSIFYGVLCVGLEGEETLTTDDIPQSSPIIVGINQMDHPETENNPDQTASKSSLAAQRERTGRMTLKDIVDYFHLPIDIAAERMQLCATVLKKVCRKHGVKRWPYRKIKSINKKLSKLRAKLSSNDAEERAHAQAQIQSLEQEKANICSGAT